MLKLYKRGPSGILYWEAWTADRAVTVHWGQVGERGQTQRLEVAPDQSAESVIAAAAARPHACGFTEAPRESLHELVVQFILDEEDIGAEAENLEFLAALKVQLDQCLGWTGNGQCTGGEIGAKEGDTLNMFCRVVEPEAAVASLAKHLESFGYGGEFCIGRAVGGAMQTVYPEDCRGDPWMW